MVPRNRPFLCLSGRLAALLAILPALLLLPAALPAAAGPLVIGFRLSPPYVIADGKGGLRGLEYELVSAAATAGNLVLRPNIEPFGRLPEDFRRKKLDAFAPASASLDLPGCLSATVLTYRNMAFSLERDRLPVNEIHDLAYYDVMAFQNAHRLLGPALAQVERLNNRYREVANQMLQVRALFSGRTDIVVADRRIFRFLMQSPDAGVDVSPPVTEHPIFPESPYSVAFHDAGACAAFDAGLQRIRADGRYDAILQRWDAALQAGTRALAPQRIRG